MNTLEDFFFTVASPFPLYTSSCSGHTVFFLDLSSQTKPMMPISFHLCFTHSVCCFLFDFFLSHVAVFFFLPNRTAKRTTTEDEKKTCWWWWQWRRCDDDRRTLVYRWILHIETGIKRMRFVYFIIFDWFCTQVNVCVFVHFCYNSLFFSLQSTF